MPDPITPAAPAAPASAPAAPDAVTPVTGEDIGNLLLAAQDAKDQATAPTPAPEGAPDGNAPEEEEATVAEENAEAEGDEPEGDGKEDDEGETKAGKLPPEVQAKIDKRIGKATAKLRAAQQAAEELRQQLTERDAKLAELQANPVAKDPAALAKLLDTHPAFLASSTDEIEAIAETNAEEEVRASTIRDTAESLLDGLSQEDRKSTELMVTLPNGREAPANVVLAELHKAKATLNRLAQERLTLAKARRHVASRAASDAEVVKTIPGVDVAALEGVRKELPFLRALPNGTLLAAQILAGRKVLGNAPGKPAPAKAAAPAAKPPPVPGKPAAAPAAIRPAVTPPRPPLNLKKFAESGGTTAALADVLAATLG